MGSPQASAAWRAKNPDKVREGNRLARLRHKAAHPEIGTRDNPRRDTRFKPGHTPAPDSGRKFERGHTINRGRISPLRGCRHSEETKAKIREKRALQVITEETRKKMSKAQLARREQNHLWKGGITAENKRLRNRLEYKLWRDTVYKRDDYTCQFCGVRGVALHADHIKPFAYFPELRFEISNGRTLCVPCHKTTDSYLSGARKNYACKK